MRIFRGVYFFAVAIETQGPVLLVEPELDRQIVESRWIRDMEQAGHAPEIGSISGFKGSALDLKGVRRKLA